MTAYNVYDWSTTYAINSTYPIMRRVNNGDLLGVTAVSPVVSSISPASGSTIVTSDSISFNVTVSDGKGLAGFTVWAAYASLGTTELIYDGSSFSSGISGTVSTITNGYSVSFSKGSYGWSADVIFTVYASSVSGASSSTNLSYTVSNVLSVTPVVTNITPAAASTIDPTDSTQFDVTVPDGAAFDSVVIWATYNTGSDLVYDGTAYADGFSGSVSNVTNGKRYNFTKDGYGYEYTNLVYKIKALTVRNGKSTNTFGYTVTVPSTTPTVTNLSPADLSTIAPDDVVEFDLTVGDGSGFFAVIIRAVYPSSNECIYTDGLAPGGFTVNTSSITNGTHFEISKNGLGWDDDVTFHVEALSNRSNWGTEIFSYTVTTLGHAPVVLNYVPASASTVAPTDDIQFDITVPDLSGISGEFIYVVYSSGVSEVVYSGGAYTSEFSGTRNAITGGYRYNFTRDGYGWSDDFTVYISAISGSGETGTDDSNYLVSGVLGTTPAVSNISPADGSTITPTDTLEFDVTVEDASGFNAIIVWLVYSDNATSEVVYDGVSFVKSFTGTVTNITGGKHFVVNRAGGFYGSPTIYVKAITNRGGTN